MDSVVRMQWIGISLVICGVIWVSVQEYVNQQPVKVDVRYVPA